MQATSATGTYFAEKTGKSHSPYASWHDPSFVTCQDIHGQFGCQHLEHRLEEKTWKKGSIQLWNSCIERLCKIHGPYQCQINHQLRISIGTSLFTNIIVSKGYCLARFPSITISQILLLKKKAKDKTHFKASSKVQE